MLLKQFVILSVYYDISIQWLYEYYFLLNGLAYCCSVEIFFYLHLISNNTVQCNHYHHFNSYHKEAIPEAILNCYNDIHGIGVTVYWYHGTYWHFTMALCLYMQWRIWGGWYGWSPSPIKHVESHYVSTKLQKIVNWV